MQVAIRSMADPHRESIAKSLSASEITLCFRDVAMDLSKK